MQACYVGAGWSWGVGGFGVALVALAASCVETEGEQAPPCECEWRSDGYCYAPDESEPGPGEIERVEPRVFGLCPTPEDPCLESICEIEGRAHRCVEVPSPDGHVPPQTEGDCVTLRCVGGTAVAVDDPSDLPDTAAVCMVGTCASGEPALVPDPGVECPLGVCDQAGQCVSDFTP